MKRLIKKNILYLFTILNFVLFVLMYISSVARVANLGTLGGGDGNYPDPFIAFMGNYVFVIVIPFVISSFLIILLKIKWVLITGAAGITLYIGAIVMVIIVSINEMIFPTYSINDILTIIVLIGYFATYISLIIFRYKLGFSEKTQTFQGDKLKRIMKVSKTIRLDILRDLLEINQKTFDNKLLNYMKQFGTKIEGNYIIVNKDTLDDFLTALDESREGWDTMEIFKVKKI